MNIEREIQGSGNTNHILSNEDLNNIDRQFNQQWQIAIPNQQQGGVVWISAPQYGYNPQSPYPYPPSPGQPAGLNPDQSTLPGLPQSTRPDSGSVVPPSSPQPIGSSPSSGPQADQPTVSRDTIVPSTGSNLESTSTTEDSNITLPTNETSEPTKPISTELSSSPSSPPSSSPSSSLSSTTTTRSISPTTKLPSGGSSSSSPTSESKPTSITLSNSTSSVTFPKPENSTNALLQYCKKPRGQFPASDCSKFINCWDEVAFEQSCPDGLLFNTEKKWCDLPKNVDCGNATTPGSGSNSTTNSTTFGHADCPEPYGTHRNKTNCAAFYVCVSYEPVHFDCAPGTAYNDQLQVCDYPYRVDCKGAPLSESDNNTSTVPSETSTNSSIPSNSSSSSTTPKPVSTSVNTNSFSTYNVTETTPSISSTSTEASSSTIPPPSISGGDSEVLLSPSGNPVASYNSNLKKLPESIVNTGVRCYHRNIYRLTADCSSVTVCQDGLTYIINCGQATSYDAYSQKCVATFTARC